MTTENFDLEYRFSLADVPGRIRKVLILLEQEVHKYIAEDNWLTLLINTAYKLI